MGLLDKFFKKKKWQCRLCGDFWGDLMVVHKVDSPVNYANDDYKGVIYKILKCRGCGKYAVVGSNPVTCHCGHSHKGVLMTNDGKYYTYCTHCMSLSDCSLLSELRKGENSYYIEYYKINSEGKYVRIGTKGVKLLQTFSHYELVWK